MKPRNILISHSPPFVVAFNSLANKKGGHSHVYWNLNEYRDRHNNMMVDIWLSCLCMTLYRSVVRCCSATQLLTFQQNNKKIKTVVRKDLHCSPNDSAISCTYLVQILTLAVVFLSLLLDSTSNVPETPWDLNMNYFNLRHFTFCVTICLPVHVSLRFWRCSEINL